MAHRILIIEDDMSTATVILRTLVREGYDPVHVDTGAAAVAEASKAAFDMVICDMNLPDATGLEIQQKLKHLPAAKQVPLMFLTGVRDSQTIRDGMAAGASSYICKPFTPDELVDALREVLD